MVELSKPPTLNEVATSMGISLGKWGGGNSTLKLNVEQRHCNKGGVAHGGIYSMLLDMALGGALVSTLPVEEWCATTQLNISFISAARPGEEITASGNVVKRGKNVAHLAGEITTNTGRVVATATGVWAIWDHKPASMG